MTEEKADQIIRCVKECWWRVGILLALVVGFTVFVMGEWPEMSQTTAAWIQAIGSIGAILIAVFVLNKQQQHSRDAEKRAMRRSERRLLISLHAEMEVRWSQYMERIGSKIGSGELREMLSMDWRTPENPFPVYSAACSELGLIGNHHTLEVVIQTYAELEGLLLTIHMQIDRLNNGGGGLSDAHDLMSDHHELVEGIVCEFFAAVEGDLSRLGIQIDS